MSNCFNIIIICVNYKSLERDEGNKSFQPILNFLFLSSTNITCSAGKPRLRQGTASTRRSVTVKAIHGRSSRKFGTGGVSGAAAVRPTSGAETIMAAINEP